MELAIEDRMQQEVAITFRSATGWLEPWIERAASPAPSFVDSTSFVPSPMVPLVLTCSAASAAPLLKEVPAKARAPVLSVTKPTVYVPASSAEAGAAQAHAATATAASA